MPVEQLSEIHNLPEKEFRVRIVKMIEDLGEKTVARIKEMYNKDLEELKSKQTEMNNTITEMKNTLEGINSRIIETEKWICELKTEWWKPLLHNRRKKSERYEDSLRDHWDSQ